MRPFTLGSLLLVISCAAADAFFSTRRFSAYPKYYKAKEVKVLAGNLIACLGKCAQLAGCGAINYDKQGKRPCGLILEIWYITQSTIDQVSYFGSRLSSGEELVVLPRPKVDRWINYLNMCLDIGCKLLQNPTNLFDVMVVKCQGWVAFDMKRAGNSGAVLTSDGVPVDTSMKAVPTRTDINPPSAEQCVIGNYYNLWVIECATWEPRAQHTVCQCKR